MKTRIISGIVMGALVAALLAAGYLLSGVVITAAVALLAAAAVYELLCNATGIKDIATVAGGCVCAFLTVLLPVFNIHFAVVWIFYSFYAVVMLLRRHSSFSLTEIAAVYGFPAVFSLQFYCLNSIVTGGMYYFLLLLNFSCVCDMGAYFVGVTCGKHKLCPEISPKKTVEGAVGGIASSVVLSVVISLCFGKLSALVLLLTIPFCILGMLGDLFASVIKRSVGLKDYSNLILGHGGILDRVDSIIMIAPLFYLCIWAGII